MPWSDWRVTLLLLGGMMTLGLHARNARMIASMTLFAVFGYVGVRAVCWVPS